jgi:hypothetical protein
MKKVVVLAGAALAAVSLTGCALLYPNWGTDQDPSDSATPTTSATPTVTPTETPTPSESPSKVLGSADVVLFDAGLDLSTSPAKLYAMADVANFAENGGQCILVFTSGTTTKTVAVSAEANVQRTQCALMELPVTGLPKGNATLHVKYESANFAGQTEKVSVVVP